MNRDALVNCFRSPVTLRLICLLPVSLALCLVYLAIRARHFAPQFAELTAYGRFERNEHAFALGLVALVFALLVLSATPKHPRVLYGLASIGLAVWALDIYFLATAFGWSMYVSAVASWGLARISSKISLAPAGAKPTLA